MTTSFLGQENANNRLSYCHKLRNLQDEHKQLQLSIKQRIDSLKVQLNMPNISVNPIQLQHSSPLTEFITSEHLEIHSIFSDKLLKDQIKFQEDTQMNEIIKNYEKRITELRLALINKQAEITYQTYERRRDTIVKRQNMQIYHNQIKERCLVKKTYLEMKKLKVQIDALQFILAKYQNKKHANLQQINRSELKSNFLNCSENDRAHLPKVDRYLTQKSKFYPLQNDNLLVKVYAMLEQQTKNENSLKQQLQLLKKQWEKTSHINNQLSKKYRKLQLEKTKLFNLNNHAKTYQFQTSQLSILQELQKQQNEESLKKELFNERDNNINQKDVHLKIRRSTLKQKKSKRTSKEN